MTIQLEDDDDDKKVPVVRESDHEEDGPGYGDGEFTRRERKKIRAIVQAHERAYWLWSSIGIVAKWIISVSAVLTIGYSVWKEAARRLGW